ncbi:MAG: AAA family ATPase [Kiritimatiellia bacterium]
MKISNCTIDNFTVFDNEKIAFCAGVNVIIGANGTGKSHLLKLLYALTQGMTGGNGTENKNHKDTSVRHLLNGLFKPENGDLSLLLRKRTDNAVASVTLESKTRHYGVIIHEGKASQMYDPSIIAQMPNAKGVFIPPNEVLAIYPGFAASYEKRELAFDQTYYDICKALSAAPLKTKNTLLSRLIPGLEDILEGSVVQKGERFYVKSKKGERAFEAHLLAEGHRKLAALVHLINNGSIDKDTILFWDEPEANLNPRLIRHVALFLRELASLGIQVFVTTHDYLLIGELSLAAEYQTVPQVPIRFLALSRQDDRPVHVQTGDTLADLQDNPILDEFAEHYQREQDASLQFVREEGGR